eukprot:4759299-Lingulodinium_polyedra.AAC.1
MAAAAPVAALDVESTQVAIDFFQDPDGFIWHHRLLLVKLGDGARWAAATPTLEVEMCDLSNHRVVPLARAAPVPQRLLTHPPPLPLLVFTISNTIATLSSEQREKQTNTDKPGTGVEPSRNRAKQSQAKRGNTGVCKINAQPGVAPSSIQQTIKTTTDKPKEVNHRRNTNIMQCTNH